MKLLQKFQSEISQLALLLLAVCLLYAPFLSDRVLRPAGDDKGYVSQALEMRERGTWFLQYQWGTPNYFKGPLHYILLRFGIETFGMNMWATLYMNLLFVLFAAACLFFLVRLRGNPEGDDEERWFPLAFATSLGVYTYVFASQMEVELVCFFSVALFLLVHEKRSSELGFWLLTGLVGWIKSPLHSVLLGASAILFWSWRGTFFKKLRSRFSWSAVLSGILLCGLGYFPAYFLDHENFMMTYVYRENLWKPPNGAPWYAAIIPTFTYFLLPWFFLFIVSVVDLGSRILRFNSRRSLMLGEQSVFFKAALCLIIPSVLFFGYHPYRVQTYTLPVLPGILLLVYSLWRTATPRWKNIYHFSLILIPVLVITVGSAVSSFVIHFSPLPSWWPEGTLFRFWLFLIPSLAGLAYALLRRRYCYTILGISAVPFLLSLTLVFSVFGEREMQGIREYINNAESPPRFTYYNLQYNGWSEWGYLNFMIPYPVWGISQSNKLLKAVERGDVILVPGEPFLQHFKELVIREWKNAKFKVTHWQRWKVHGRSPSGRPLWEEAWIQKDLQLLERSYYIVEVIL